MEQNVLKLWCLYAHDSLSKSSRNRFTGHIRQGAVNDYLYFERFMVHKPNRLFNEKIVSEQYNPYLVITHCVLGVSPMSIERDGLEGYCYVLFFPAINLRSARNSIT